MKRLQLGFIGAALSSLPATIIAQDAPVTPQVEAPAQGTSSPAPREGRSPEEGAKRFLERKQARQTRRESALGQRRQGGEQQELRRLYRALGVARPRGATLSGETATALGNALETDAVQLLASLDFRPARIRRIQAAGFNPVEAAVAHARGISTPVQQALLSDIVAVVRVTEIRPDRSSDGFRSTALLEIVEPISGRSPARAIALRQMSGPDDQGNTAQVSTDLIAVPNQTYVVMLSRGMYEQMAVENGGQPTGGGSGSTQSYVPLGTTYIVDGDNLIPLFSGVAQATSLSQLKQALAPLARVKADDQTDATSTTGPATGEPQ